MLLTFSSTDSESFSRFMILMATFWLVTQCTPSLTSPLICRMDSGSRYLKVARKVCVWIVSGDRFNGDVPILKFAWVIAQVVEIPKNDCSVAALQIG